MVSREGIYFWYEIELRCERIPDDMCETFGLIESSPLQAPGMERDEKHHIRKGDGCFPEFVRDECSERVCETFRKRIFVGMNAFRDERIAEWRCRENAIERILSGTGVTENPIWGDSVLTVRAVEFGLSWEIVRAAFAEERALLFAGEAVEREEESDKMLEDKHNDEF